jgi:flagellar hook-associated protein 1
MGSILTSLLNSANAIDVMDRQLAVIQNNVSNANTPGFVRQTQSVQAMALEPSAGLLGGVTAGPILSARSEYAEETVRRQNSLFGSAEQRAADLTQIEPLFDLSSTSSISNSLNKFFQSFSQLSVNPNDTVSRQNVIDQSQTLAASFRQTASGLVQAANNADVGIRSTLTQINSLTAQIATLNASRTSDYRNAMDPGIDAQIHSALENLSELGDITVLQDNNGSFNVYLGGQTPLVIGNHAFALGADTSATTTAVLDPQGKDVTATIHTGKLGGLLDEQRNTIPSYTSDLNQLAQTLATSVNAQLTAGVDANGATPAVDLFYYDPSAPAGTLAVTGIQPDQIAAARANAPGGNGNALDVAALADSKLIDGSSLTQFYGNLAAKLGQDVSSSKDEQQSQQGLVAQARNMRSEISSVSLNEEAALMMQIQRQYQAAGKVIGVLDSLTDTLLSMVK